MIFRRHIQCLVLLLAILFSGNMTAQTFVRYVVPSAIGTKPLFSDSVLSPVTLPRGVSRVDNNRFMHDAVFELTDILLDSDSKLLCVYVCGSASPDGLWQNNVDLSAARTEAAADYLHYVTGIPEDRIYRESLNEDWDRLYELVEQSDIIYKDDILEIIVTTDWGERKTALRELGGGEAWEILMRDFFPRLRCVRIAIFCLWDPSK